MTCANKCFDSYRDSYPNIKLERDKRGILTMRLHTKGESLVFSASVHEQLATCFLDIARDLENRVLILTGTGHAFCDAFDMQSFQIETPLDWDHLMNVGQGLLNNLLAIDIPVIGVVNGPSSVHSELAILSDIVLASETAYFQDGTHFTMGIVPGDGSHAIWPHLLGLNRGRYFLFTGQSISADEAQKLGLVAEVYAPAQLMGNAMQYAEEIAAKPRLATRYTRQILTRNIKKLVESELTGGFALQSLAAIEMLQQPPEDT